MFLGQLTPRVDVFKNIYQLDLITNLQVQLALFSVLLSIALGMWNRSLMLTLLVINGLVISANFSGYVNFDFLSEQKEQIKSRSDLRKFSIVQYTFDAEISQSLPPIYDSLTQLDKDIIVLFNVNDLHKSYLKDLSKGKFSYGLRQKEGLASNIAIITKFAIQSKRRNTFLDERGDIIELKLFAKDQTVKLTVMHPPEPVSKLHWQRRNLMLNTLETMENTNNTVSPYALIISELYTSVWSRHFPMIDNYRSCTASLGVYGNWYFNNTLKLLGNFGAINTSHCFYSYRLKLSNLESNSILGGLHNMVMYELVLQNNT